MPNYVKKLLIKYRHPIPRRAQYTPRQPKPIVHGPQQPCANPDTSDALNKLDLIEFQSILGTVLYYARMIDMTLLCAINDLSLAQAAPTKQSREHLNALLDYLYTKPNASIMYRASNMIIKVHSDGSYLSVPGGRSRAAGHFFCGNNVNAQHIEPYQGAIYQECSIIKPVVASAAECETATLFLNCQTAIILRITAKEMGHPQAATPIQIDNTTTNNFVHDYMQQKKSKAFDMRLHWLRDRVNQQQFEIYWMDGKCNYADYYSKHHAAAHHKKMRSKYLVS